MDDRTQETPHQPQHLRLVGGSVNPEPGVEVPLKPPHNPVVDMILEGLWDAAVASSNSADDPEEARRMKVYWAYEALYSALPSADNL